MGVKTCRTGNFRIGPVGVDALARAERTPSDGVPLG